MNGDVLTKVDFRRLVSFYESNNSKITICVKEFHHQIPYGVMNLEGGQLLSFDEKPSQKFNVNAGVYMLDSSLLKYIPKGEYFDMSSFLNALLEKNIRPDCFPMIEQWKDIGLRKDLDDARLEITQ